MTVTFRENAAELDGLPTPRRTWAAAGLWIGMAMSVIDSSIVNIALPTISRDLSVSSATTTWIVTAYQIAIVMTLLPMAALGERLGYHRVYLGGLVLFILMSVCCAFAPGLEALAAFRFVQGLGAAAMMGVNGAQLRFVWPRALLGRGIAYNAVVVSCTAAAGPGLAGFLLTIADWPWLFLVNVPIGLLALALVLGFGPRTPAATSTFDYPGAALNAIMFCALFLAASEAVHGGPSLWLAGCMLTGLAAGAALVARSRSNTRPMIPFDLIRIKRMQKAYGASICAFAAQMCMLVSLPFLLEGQLHLDVATVGFLLLSLPIMIALSSPVAGHMADKHWAGLMSALGLCLNAAALVALAVMIRHHAPLAALAAALACCGLGFGLFQSPNNNVMLRTGPLDRAGAASGMQSTCRLTGQTIGALLAALALRFPQLGAEAALYLSAGLTLCAAAFARAR
ncbi:MFS transporter [Sphingobium nicotianae]|uniref:MFS transporter n=1 Tax=Sphingobium nicotianae TaxID=2782607 RepID=A0A9X1IPJ0_9SPHN|nr:MFS transporter [Sphingobium nicotianae]MBT2186132.1 MFS transporter [Sphingobium nicotianae]